VLVGGVGVGVDLEAAVVREPLLPYDGLLFVLRQDLKQPRRARLAALDEANVEEAGAIRPLVGLRKVGLGQIYRRG